MTFKNNNFGLEVLTSVNPIKFQKFNRNLLRKGTDKDTYTELFSCHTFKKSNCLKITAFNSGFWIIHIFIKVTG